jgi:hypothetical protein
MTNGHARQGLSRWQRFCNFLREGPWEAVIAIGTVPAAIVALIFNYFTMRDLQTQIEIARDGDAATRIRAALEVLYACKDVAPTRGRGQAADAPPDVAPTGNRGSSTDAGPRRASEPCEPKNAAPIRAAALREFLTLSYQQAVRRERTDEMPPRVELSDADRTTEGRARLINDCFHFAAGRRGVARLPNVDLSDLRIERLLFCGVDLRGAIIRRVHAEHVLFVNANLSDTRLAGRFIEVVWANSNFDGATMDAPQLMDSTFHDYANACPPRIECFSQSIPGTMQGVRLYRVAFAPSFYRERCADCQALASRTEPRVYARLDCSAVTSGRTVTYPCRVTPMNEDVPNRPYE